MLFINTKRLFLCAEKQFWIDMKGIEAMPKSTPEERRKVHWAIMEAHFVRFFSCNSFLWINLVLIAIFVKIASRNLAFISSVLLGGWMIFDWLLPIIKPVREVTELEKNQILHYVIQPCCEAFFNCKLTPEAFDYTGQPFCGRGYYYELPTPVMDQKRAIALTKKIQRKYAEIFNVSLNRVIHEKRIAFDGQHIFVRK